jgi:signal transduction histidine kinase
MTTLEMLHAIRPTLLMRTVPQLARGTQVRDKFQRQLEQLLNVLEQAAVTGDSAWLDTVVYDWASALTESEIEKGLSSVLEILSQIMALTFEVARELLPPEDALELITVLTPHFAHGLMQASQFEINLQTAYYTNEIANMRKKMDRLNQSKTNFVSIAAHELKTPITLIEGYTSMLVEATPKEQEYTHEMLVGVQQGLLRLRLTVDDMIDVSVIDNGMLSLNQQAVQVKRLLYLLASELRPIVLERKLNLEIYQFGGSEETLIGDPERLYQAFKNLLTNAIKFTPDGGNVRVDGRMLPGFVEVTIHDTGIGIAPEDQEAIFEKFGTLGNAQLHSSGRTKFKGGGPGLGLAITKGIIEAHGGAIWVESDGYDEVKCPGSIFHVLLPLRAQGRDIPIGKLISAFNVREK